MLELGFLETLTGSIYLDSSLPADACAFKTCLLTEEFNWVYFGGPHTVVRLLQCNKAINMFSHDSSFNSY